MTRLFAFLMLVAGALAPVSARAQLASDSMATGNVEARLTADSIAVTPGQTFYVALHQDIRDGWHTYWRNPGDSGEATRLVLDLPDGWEAGEIVWPAPHAIPVGPLTNYGYEGEIVLPVPVTVPADYEGGAATIGAESTWLVCEDICIPESAEFEISLRVTDSAPRAHPRFAQEIEDALAGMPKAASSDSIMAIQGDRAALAVPDADLAAAGAEGRLREVYFFPYEGGLVEAPAAQPVSSEAGALRLELTPGFAMSEAEPPFEGVLAYDVRGDGGWTREARIVSAGEGELSFAAAPRVEGAGGEEGAGGGVSNAATLWQALIGAFLGGLILNLMPCVFPVLSLKALGFAQRAHDHKGEVRAHGLIFLSGVLVTFALLGGLLIALKAGGAAVGWGFQLQSPAVILALTLLFFAIALNLLGFFEIGGGLQNIGSGLAARSGTSGAFFTGALAVIVATPCTAPFMAGALGYALTLPAISALMVFLALGLGLAAPFTLLSFAPGLLSRLPKPGPWMDRFKQFMAFPMLAAAVWLVWVISVQAGPAGVAAALAGMLALGFAVWAGRLSSLFGKALAAAAVLAALLTVPAAAQLSPASSGGTGVETETDSLAWSPEALAKAREEGVVFVDFTAAWCITCQVNERVVLNSKPVKQAFAEEGVTMMVADWTNKDAVIAAELEKFGRAGVPLYLVYRPGEESPQILPQILTERAVIEAVRASAPPSA